MASPEILSSFVFSSIFSVFFSAAEFQVHVRRVGAGLNEEVEERTRVLRETRQAWWR